MPNNYPQLFMQMTTGTNAKLSSGATPPEQILDVFTGLLWSPEPMCTMAVRALTEIGPEAVPHLTKACVSSSLAPSVHDAVGNALAKMGRAAKDAVPELLRLLEQGHPRPQSLIIAVARIAPDDERVLNYLSKIVASENDAQQDVVVAALNRIASYKVLDILKRARVRPPDEEENLLVHQLANGSDAEKSDALDKVQQRLPFGAQFFVDPLIAIIEQSPGSADRHGDTSILAEQGDAFNSGSAGETPAKERTPRASELSFKASHVLALALPSLPDALTTYLEELIYSDSRISRAIARGDAEPILAWVGSLLCSSDSSSSVCYLCARVLRNFGARGVPYLTTGMRSSSGHREFILARELGRLGKDAAPAIPHLMSIINHSRGFPWGGERSAVLDALAQIAPEDERVVSCLSKIAANEKDKWQRAAIAALKDVSGESRQADSLSAANFDARAKIAKACVGIYKGQLRLGGQHFVVETRLWLSKNDPTKLCGDYIVHMGHLEYGELTQQGSIDERKILFEWSDSYGSGILETNFNFAFTDFRGVYGDGLTWTGVRGC